MLTIFKVKMTIQDEQIIFIENGARFLTIQIQYGEPVLWVVVDPNAPSVERKIYIRGTGHMLGEAEQAYYVGTFQLEGGAFVGHVFVEPTLKTQIDRLRS